MGSRLARRLILLTLLATLVVLSFAAQAWAGYRYAGNYRSLGYGVKADISTPSSMPTVANGIVLNFVANSDSGQWLAVGWVQGDGYTRAPDGVYWPTVPTSYEESNCAGNYFEAQYSAQPLNFARSYESVSTGVVGSWVGIIAGTRRYAFAPYTTPVVVEGLTEIAGTTQPHTRAVFSGVQYRGQYTYFNFDQNYEQANNPPYASFNSYYNYTCYNGM
jgi:hypothetical protein